MWYEMQIYLWFQFHFGHGKGWSIIISSIIIFDSYTKMWAMNVDIIHVEYSS